MLFNLFLLRFFLSLVCYSYLLIIIKAVFHEKGHLITGNVSRKNKVFHFSNPFHKSQAGENGLGRERESK
jgi:hypothetical protein